MPSSVNYTGPATKLIQTLWPVLNEVEEFNRETPKLFLKGKAAEKGQAGSYLVFHCEQADQTSVLE